MRGQNEIGMIKLYGKERMVVKISVCIITKNEAHYLKGCLEKLSQYPFEIVVVDTGSEDDSVEVAKRYTDKVFEYGWHGDFSAARNYSVSCATNDMIMIVDTDEFVQPFDYDAVIKLIEDNSKKVGRINLNNQYTRNDEKHSTMEKLSRVFDRRLYKYEGIVHEQIVAKDGAEFETFEVPVEYLHVGYDGSPEILARKTQRNIELLLQELSKKEDPYILYQLGKSFYMQGDYSEALDYFERATGYDLNPALEYVVDLVVSYGYALINTNQTKQALMFENLYEEFSYSADFVFLMGLIYMNNAFFEAAVNEFDKAKSYSSCNLNGVNSFLADYNIGVIFECLGHVEEAIAYYKKCPDYEKALNRIAVLTGQEG